VLCLVKICNCAKVLHYGDSCQHSTDVDEDDDLEDFLLLNYNHVINTQEINTINIRQFVEFIIVIHSSSLTSHVYNLEGVSNVFYTTDIISPHPLLSLYCISLFYLYYLSPFSIFNIRFPVMSNIFENDYG